MRMHGTLQTNLEGAILAARRHRGAIIYADTLAHWNGLLEVARGEITSKSGPSIVVLTHLAEQLEDEIGLHSAVL